jgi:hypothetical protein
MAKNPYPPPAGRISHLKKLAFVERTVAAVEATEALEEAQEDESVRVLKFTRGKAVPGSGGGTFKTAEGQLSDEFPIVLTKNRKVRGLFIIVDSADASGVFTAMVFTEDGPPDAFGDINGTATAYHGSGADLDKGDALTVKMKRKSGPGVASTFKQIEIWLVLGPR